MKAEIIIEENANTEVMSTLINGIRSFSAPYFGEYEKQENFVIYATDKDSKKILGGIGGYIFFEHYAHADKVWVDESCRNQGIGRRLFETLEDFLKQKGCKFVQLGTLDFQARPFYEKLGFECIGTVKKLVKEYDCYYMRKAI